MSITASALVTCYCLFTLVRIGHRGGAPDEILWRERPILLTALIYFLFVIVARNQ